MTSVKWIEYADGDGVVKRSDQAFGLLTELAFSSDSGEYDGAARDIVSQDTYNGRIIYRTRPVNPIQYQFTLIRQDFGEWSLDFQHRVIHWLTNSDRPSYLRVCPLDADDQTMVNGAVKYTYDLYGVVTNVQLHKYGNGRVFGLVVTFDCSKACSPLNTHTETNTKSITVANESTVPAVLRIKTLEAGKLVITTNCGTRSHQIAVDNMKVDELLNIDGANKIISEPSNTRLYGVDFNWAWPMLYNGNNTFNLSLACDITIEWRNEIMVGDR